MTATSNGKHDAPTALDFASSYARAVPGVADQDRRHEETAG